MKSEKRFIASQATDTRFTTDLVKSSVDTILDERGKRYGKFETHALLSHNLKRAMHNHTGWHRLVADQTEALDMIAHKIGRIINGDPDYADSWDGLAGYATLVADRLRGVSK